MSQQPTEQKIYVPKSGAKQVTFQSGKTIMKISFHADTMIEFLKKHANEKGYVNLGMSKRNEVGQYGDTHCLWLDTWKPNSQNKPAAVEKPQPKRKISSDTPSTPQQSESYDVPF